MEGPWDGEPDRRRGVKSDGDEAMPDMKKLGRMIRRLQGEGA